MSRYVLGIDLGTTNSVVAVAEGGKVRVLSDEAGARLIPSVVSFTEDGNVLVGDAARERRLVDAKHTVYSVKRLIGRPFSAPEVQRAQARFAFALEKASNGGVVVAVRGQTYSLTEISAFVLREVKRVAEAMLGEPCEQVVITVPANFNELQRSATKAAGRVAGLDVIRILNEPTAAALAYGYSGERAERVAVYDLGGGTFDLTVLELEDDVFEVVATAGDSFLGGDDLDLVVAEVMAEACRDQHGWDPHTDVQAFERLRAAGEWAKCQLTSSEVVDLTVEELAYDARGVSIDLRFETSREEIELRARAIVERSFAVCRRALAEAGLVPSDIDAAILVGGSTRMPLVRRMVEEFFGTPPRVDLDPDLVVAQGAAIHALAITGGASRAERSTGQAPTKPMSVADLRAAQRKRLEAREQGPKQPAFAPTSQYEVPPVSDDIAARLRAKLGGQTGRQLNRPDATLKGIGGFAPPMPPGAVVGTRRPLPADGPIPAMMAHAIVGADAITGDALDDELEELDFELVEDDDAPAARESVEIAPDYLEEARRAGALPSRSIAPAALFAGFGEELDLELGSDEPSDEVLLVMDDDEPTPPEPSEPEPRRVIPDTRPNVPVLEIPERAPPLLMDVTPHALGIETVSGICQHLIRRNVPIPCEQSRTFTTGRDGQTEVVIHVFQGESRSASENEALGAVELSGLRSAPRGEVKIEVTFVIDPSGTLDVRAIDQATGVAQETRINLLGGADEGEHAAMRERHDHALPALS
jgi:molecular chaperone DnaK